MDSRDGTPTPPELPSGSTAPAGALIWRVLHRIEDTLLGLAFVGIVAMPIAEMILRGVFQSSVPGGNAITQHLTLLVSMLGGAVAAREARLLTITQGFAKAPGLWGPIFEIIRAGVSATVSALLAWAGVLFVFSEVGVYELPEGFLAKLKAVAQLFTHDLWHGNPLGFGLPVTVAQIVIALGFALVAARLIRHAGRGWLVRLVAGLLAFGLTFWVLGTEPETMMPAYVLLGALFVAGVLGAPIFALLGGAAVFLFWGSFNPLGSAAIAHYSLVTNATIPALPLFTLAGYFLAEGGTSQRMVRLLRAFTGDMRAGPALVTVVACAFFTSLTGASGVTILALGGLLVPFLQQSRYTERGAIGMLTGAGSVGMLFAPCLPLILYAIVAKVRIEAMFLSGIVPGVLLGAVTAAWGIWKRPPTATDEPHWSFDLREAGSAFVAALPELFIPIVSLGGIFSGLATPVEAAAITALYTFVIEMFVYRDLKLPALAKVMRECGLLIGGVLLILGVAQALTNYLIDAQVPAQLVDLVTTHVSSKLVFIALLTVVLLIVGCMMDVFSAIIVVVPLIAPLGVAYGLNPIHLGVLFLANLGLGFLTPPVGMNLFIASYRFNKPMSEVLRAALPYFWLQFAAVLLISYWPRLSLLVPGWFGY